MVKQNFGGDWTQDKLRRVAAYLRAYNVALKNKPFTREYIDAFAGTGYREIPDSDESDDLLFSELGEPEAQQFLDGSARIALNVEPGFHRFTFIERDPEKVRELEKLRDEFRGKNIRIECGDANDYVQAICRESWRNRRAVLFLDPFGMQVAWQTLEAVARTKCIDVWLLFPLAVAISRLLKKDGNIPEAWVQRLDFVFGNRSWQDELYPVREPQKTTQQTLFDTDPESEIRLKGNFAAIEEFFRTRLRTIFAGVAENPVWLRNSKNVPLYQLFFMAGNKNGAPIAVNIAEDIMSRP